MTYAPSHLQRQGDHGPGRGDLTGARAVTAREQAQANAQDVDRAILELRDPDTQLEWITVPGKSARYPVPRDVAAHLTKRR
jgi:hypothetical protein